MKDLVGDPRCTDPIIQLVRSTEIGCRCRERCVIVGDEIVEQRYGTMTQINAVTV
jgi:hypothetical protein